MSQLSNLMLNQQLGLLPAKFWNKAKMPFTYIVEFLPATLSITTSATLQISSDSWFAICSQQAVVVDVTNATKNTTPSMTVAIQDAGTGRFWSNAPVQIENWFGSAQLPYRYDIPNVLNGGSTLTVSITNLIATSFNVRLAFSGFKIFDYPQS